MKLTIVAVALIMGATVTAHLPVNRILYEAEAKVVEPSEVVWTPALVEAEIRRVFPEQPDLMVRVAFCESSLRADAEGPTNDGGVFQIHRPSHHARLEGVDLYDAAENIRFARELYDESGLRPWKASRHCWSK